LREQESDSNLLLGIKSCIQGLILNIIAMLNCRQKVDDFLLQQGKSFSSFPLAGDPVEQSNSSIDIRRKRDQ
jgi:hypothetical protein